MLTKTTVSGEGPDSFIVESWDLDGRGRVVSSWGPARVRTTTVRGTANNRVRTRTMCRGRLLSQLDEPKVTV